MPDALTLTFSILALVISIGGLFYTHLQLRLAKQVRRDQLDPHVTVDMAPRAPESQMLCLVISNLGQTSARDVKVHVTPCLRSSLGRRQEAALERAIHRTIPFIPPGRRIVYNVDIASKLYDADPPLPMQYTFTVEANGPLGHVEPEKYEIDLEILRDIALEKETVVGQLMAIAKKLPGDAK